MYFKKRFIIFLAALISASFVYAADVKVVSVTGKCEYENNGVWEPLTEGQVLSQGAKIQTGFKSELILSLTSSSENSTLTVAQLSRMTIDQLFSSDTLDKTNVYMDTGTVKAEINKTEDNKVNFTVTSPYATASVRGTILTYRNVVGGVSVITERGNVAVWVPSETEEEAEEDSEQEVVIPENSYEVLQNQQVDVSGTGNVKDTMEVASGRTQELETVSTAAEDEANSFASEYSDSNVTVNNEKGSLGVSVEWK